MCIHFALLITYSYYLIIHSQFILYLVVNKSAQVGIIQSIVYVFKLPDIRTMK